MAPSPQGGARSFAYSADARARFLILGSMPGAESLRRQEYYAFKHNAFWRIMGELYSFSPALPYPERLAALRDAGVALWDVLAECERPGSLDASIRAPRAGSGSTDRSGSADSWSFRLTANMLLIASRKTTCFPPLR